MDKNINYLFDPKTIAVIGASNEKGSVGYSLFANLIKSKFKGKVYPINIKRKKIQGKSAYKSIKEVPSKIDLAIIAVPAKIVPLVMKECGLAKVKGAVIISAGFNEIGEEGMKLQDRIGEIARNYGIRVIGPNCLGFIRPGLNLNASFASKMALPGKIAFISQSGALCTAMLDWSNQNNVGYSYFISIGSMVDLDFTDLIEYLGDDKETQSILIYMETLSNARRFLEVARKVSTKKPIFAIKTGRCLEGAKAAKSHTGSLTGNDAVFSAAFAKAGIARIDAVDDLFNIAKALSMQPQPSGKKLAIITNAGGVGVVAADSLIFSGGKLAELSKDTINNLNNILPAAWSHNNPVDMLGDADPERYKNTLEICLKDKEVDGALVVLTPQAMTEPTRVASELIKVANKDKKTVLTSWLGGNDVAAGIKCLQDKKIPNFSTPESAIRSFMFMQKIKGAASLRKSVNPLAADFTLNKDDNDNIIKNALTSGQTCLNEVESKRFLANYGLPLARGEVAKSADEAGEIAAKLGFPVVMKILSADILHKIDIGGVRLDIKTREEAMAAYNKIINQARKKMPEAIIAGVYIEEEKKMRYELLLGYKKDKIFGPIIAFGTGGTAVEIYKDTKIGLPPLSLDEIQDMVAKTKIYKLLAGFRNMPAVDIEQLQMMIYKFSRLVMDFQDKIKEIDINPLAIDANGAVILDAKIIFEQ